MVNRLFTLDGARVAYGLPSKLLAALPKCVPSISRDDDGNPLFSESQIDNWIRELSGNENMDRLVVDFAASMSRIAERLDPQPSDIVGTPYVANKLGCSTAWITKLIRTGELPANCVVEGTGYGRLWKFHRSAVDRWIKNR